MSRRDLSVTVIIGVIGIILMGIPAWDVLDKRGVVYASLLILAWLIGAGLVGYAVYRNVRAAQEAESRQARVDNISAQQIASLQAEAKALQQKEASLRTDNTQLVKVLQGKQNEIQEMEQRYLKNLEEAKVRAACSVLAAEADYLWNKMQGINQDATAAGVEDSKAILALRTPLVPVPWPWHARALLEFQAVYSEHQNNVSKFAPNGFASELKSYPIPTTEMTYQELVTMLLRHKNKLLSCHVEG